MISRKPPMSIFEGKFMLYIKSHGPINAPTEEIKPQRLGFNWDLPAATFTLRDGILQTDRKYIGVFPRIDLERSLYYIPWMSDVEVQKVRFDLRGSKYMMRVDSVPVFVNGDALVADEAQRVRRRINPALFEILPPLDD